MRDRILLITTTFNVVIVRLDRTIQKIYKRMDSPIKSGNDILHFGN
jgi:hypothetical protein